MPTNSRPGWPLLATALYLLMGAPLFAAEKTEREAAAERASAAAGMTREPGAELDASQLSKPPKLKNKPSLVYPLEAKGKVTEEVRISLLITLDDHGEVSGVSVLEPKIKTELGFEDAAITAAYQLSFEPAEVEGHPVEVQIRYEFRFPASKPEPTDPPPEQNPVSTETEAKPTPEPVENLSGVLLERGTRTPMSGILITVYRNDDGKPTGYEATTDAEGRFKFFDLPQGKWKILAEVPGYYPFRTSEELREGEGLRATYFIEKGSYSPFDIVVAAPRPRKEVTKVIIERDVIDKTPGAMGDPLAVIQNFAGVARVQGMGMGQIVVRGSAPQDTQVLIDNTYVPLAYHFGGLRSVVPVGMIENLEFYPGNFSPYYGRVIGGVIDVTPKKLKPRRFGGYADVNLLDSGLYLEAPLGDKGSIAIAGRRSYIDYIMEAMVPSNAPINLVTAPKYYDWQLLGNYRPAAAHDLRLFVFASDDRFKLLFKTPGQAGTEFTGNQLDWTTTFYRGTGTWKYVPSERFTNTLHLSQGRDIMNMTFFQFFQKLTIDTTEVRDTARVELSKQAALSLGVDVSYFTFGGAVRSPSPPAEGEEAEDIDLSKVMEGRFKGRWFLPGAYAEMELRPAKGLLILPGLRYDYFSHLSQHTLAPRFTLRYQLSDVVALKGAVGRYHQAPQPFESDKDFGNPALKVQASTHYALGSEWKPWKNGSVDVTAFYKSMEDMVSRTDATVIRDGKVVELRYDNKGRGQVYGMEFVVRQDLTARFSGWLAYTLSRSHRTESGQLNSRLFQFDQPHILTVVGMYSMPHNWQVSARFRLVSGNPLTPITRGVFNAGVNEYKPVMGPVYSSRNPAFHQLDFRIDKRWVYNRWMFNAYLDIQNVYNRANAEGLQYNYDYTQRKVSSGLPLYPILGLRGEF